MKDKEVNTLIKASNIAAQKQVEHLLLIKNADGTVKCKGTGKILKLRFLVNILAILGNSKQNRKVGVPQIFNINFIFSDFMAA